MHEPLKNRTYLGIKLFFNFMGADFLAPKSGHRCEKHTALGPDKESSEWEKSDDEDNADL